MSEGVRRIFYDKTTGERIHEIGREGDFTLPTIEQDIVTYTALSERNRETFDVIELPFGAYAQDFAECNGYRVNVETRELEFSYPDPNAPQDPPVFQRPLSEQIKEQKQYTQQLNDDLMSLSDYVTTL
jgi:hypothetical protein